ncbi:integral membrane protein [marine actinobacterium PHSC20C1]|nr:integral membrane protein [marine actinobacterium PHSC20C1]
MSSVAEKLQRKSQRQTSVKQVRLKLVYIDFWSAVKFSFLVAASLGIVLIVATMLVWIVLNSTGIFGDLDSIFRDILTQESNFSVTSSFSFGQVAMFSVIVALLNTLVGTALGAIASMLYNFSVRLTGGILVGFTNN